MKFKTIDSKDNKKYKLFKSLYLKKNRDKYKLFLLEGKKLLSEALNENLDIENIICTEKFVENFEFKENFLDKVIILSEKLFKNLTELTNSEGVITIVNYIEEKKISSKNIICLENVSDPGNFGTIIRTANAFGIKDILTINCVDKYNSKVLRATMGAMFRTNIVDSEIEKIKELQKDGYRLISTTLSENSKSMEHSSWFVQKSERILRISFCLRAPGRLPYSAYVMESSMVVLPEPVLPQIKNISSKTQKSMV